jgi:hypothetical protein
MLGIPTVWEIQSLTNLPSTHFKTLLTDTLEAMYVAAASGSTTTSDITIAPASQNDVLALLNQFNQYGYTMTNNGTVITVSWLTVAQNT